MRVCCCWALTGLIASASWAAGPAQRSVELTCTAAIDEIPAGAKTIDLWMPVPQDTGGQRVSSVKVVRPEGGDIASEPEYGNAMWHKRFHAPFDSGLIEAELVFVIHRDEIAVPEAKTLAVTPKPASPMKIYLAENSLIPVHTDPIKAIAVQLSLDAKPPIAAARSVYDWLIDEFTYDWKAPGAGKGDVRWACDSKTGDCSDYSSMFIALMRHQGIPADHEFGYPIRSEASEGRIPYHHCWVRFHAEGLGWIPVDISEADKHPELRAYNFGGQASNLMKFTHGRDLTLAPPQAGPPLNKFIHPYVEIDGKPIEKVKRSVYFKNL